MTEFIQIIVFITVFSSFVPTGAPLQNMCTMFFATDIQCSSKHTKDNENRLCILLSKDEDTLEKDIYAPMTIIGTLNEVSTISQNNTFNTSVIPYKKEYFSILV